MCAQPRRIGEDARADRDSELEVAGGIFANLPTAPRYPIFAMHAAGQKIEAPLRVKRKVFVSGLLSFVSCIVFCYVYVYLLYIYIYKPHWVA